MRGGTRGRAFERRDTHTLTRPGGRRQRAYGVRRARRRRARSTLLRDGRDRAADAGAADRRSRMAVRCCARAARAAARRPFWAVTLRAVAGPAAGVHAELRLWPESNPEWFRGRLAVLCDAELALIAALTLEQQRALLERNLAERSYTGFLETAADGLADVAYLELARPRIDVPPDLPEHAPARRVPPPVDAPGAPSAPPPRSRSSRTRRRSRACAGGSRPPARWRSTSRPIAGRSARPPTGRRPTARCGSCRWLREVGGEIVCGVVDCYRVAPRPLLRLLADGREIIAHNARYEQAWLTWHFGLPAWSAGLRHELRVPRLRAPLVDPGSGLRAARRDARHRHAQAARRAQGRPWSRLVGRRAAARRPARLRRLRRGGADRAARARARARRGLRLHGPGARGLAHGLPSRPPGDCRQPHSDAWAAAFALIEEAADDAALAHAAARHPAPAAARPPARAPARALRRAGARRSPPTRPSGARRASARAPRRPRGSPPRTRSRPGCARSRSGCGRTASRPAGGARSTPASWPA